jgi:hypothetical protein
MHSFQAQTDSSFGPAGNLGINRLLALLAAILDRAFRGRQDVTPGYEGYAWCDSLEQQVNSDTAICRRARL